MNRYGQRRCLEACHINMGHHALNEMMAELSPQLSGDLVVNDVSS